MFMQSLILIAHGSRLESSNQEVADFTHTLSKYISQDFSFLSHAFLELASPSIPETIEQCASKGASKIVFFPYFLAAGKHIIRDIPAMISEVMENYPDIAYELRPHLGSDPDLPELIASSLLRK